MNNATTYAVELTKLVGQISDVNAEESNRELSIAELSWVGGGEGIGGTK